MLLKFLMRVIYHEYRKLTELKFEAFINHKIILDYVLSKNEVFWIFLEDGSTLFSIFTEYKGRLDTSFEPYAYC